MGLLDLLGIPGAISPISSFAELIKLFSGNGKAEKEQLGNDVVINDNQENKMKQNEYVKKERLHALECVFPYRNWTCSLGYALSALNLWQTSQVI